MKNIFSFNNNYWFKHTILSLTIVLGLATISLGQSPYTKNVDIPPYDASNNEHFLINSSSDWIHINDSDKRFFYVVPNTTHKTVSVKADGSKNAKRYISLYNGNDTHPAKLAVSEQANVKLIFDDAKYWVVDRMSSINYHYGTSEGFCFELKNGSQNIVLNRLYLTNFFEGIIIYGYDAEPYNENITIQNSRFDSMSPSGIDGDAVAIKLRADPWDMAGKAKNILILNNEIRNCNDGIMFQSYEAVNVDVSFPGAVIDYNHIYVDTAVYTDGHGNLKADGKYAFTENALDLKAGSSDASNPMIVTNNYFWGFRRTDKNGGGSGSKGAAVTGHYGTKNLQFNNNVIFNSNRALSFSDKQQHSYSLEDALFSGNIFYNNGFDPYDVPGYGYVFYESKNVTFKQNTIVDVNKKAFWMTLEDVTDMYVSCNAIIDSYRRGGSSPATVENNTFYNTTALSSDGVSYSTVAEAKMGDLTFTTDRYTNNPRTITLPGVITTDESPHASGCFGSSLGQAVNPSPSNGMNNIDTNVTLSWVAGLGVTSNDLYFGTTNPPAFIGNQSATIYTPGILEKGTTYYWRVDEKNDNETLTGVVWSFITKSISSGGDINLPKSDNIIGYWKLDGDAKDASGNGKDGVARLVTYSTDAKEGSHSAVFSSTPEGDGSGISLPLDITPADIKTLAFWMNRAGDGLGGANESYIIRRSSHFYVKIKNSGILKLAVPSSEGEIKAEVSGIPNSTWVHIAGVISADTVKLYINGLLKKTAIGTQASEDGEYFGLGSGFNSPWASFNGKMDDVILWNTPLTSDEIQNVFDKKTDIEETKENEILPTEFSIGNYPNPFNPTTTISYNLPNSGDVKVQIYDVMGRLISELVNSKQSAGHYNVVWNGKNRQGSKVASGMYICQINHSNKTKTSKMLLLK